MLCLIYISAITAANLLVAHFGPWFSPINSFLLIGLDLAVRDALHDRWAGPMLWPRMLALIAAAGVVSFVLNPATAKIAVASVVAFSVAAAVDALAYHAARRLPFLQKSVLSNVAGAAADSLLFPTLAFGALLPNIVAFQFAAKVLGGTIWSVIFWRFQGGKA